jgi:hypothetical protein
MGRAIAFAALLSAFGQNAYAGDNGFYIGGALGLARKDAPGTEFELFSSDLQNLYQYTPTAGGASFDDSDKSYSLLLGYRFTRHIAIEGGYARLGQLAYRSATAGNFANDAGEMDISMDTETSGFTVSALCVLPINYSWEVYGRAGMLIASNRFALRVRARGDVFAQPNISGSFSRGSDELYAGLGVSVRFFDIYDVRLEYQRFFDAGLELTLNSGDLDVATLGLIVTF